ncbi:hypothetical protein Vadar_015248 [Vaccinium darrowii]|uniref:Uncharacterized protein n=1 Tax=Vaccinium darrowii TaxID=229202 RepID=A0ACB7XHK7_9ERIC|nr:hypothetical protein Vadar_015248 [Vaccinium darrowii]
MASSNQTVLQFTPSSTSLTAKVHPLVMFNICDCFVRRPDQAERVIGTLLGSVLPDGTVDIRNCYAVPHNESSDQKPNKCKWCRNEAIDDMCFSKSKAWRLPPQVFSCD